MSIFVVAFAKGPLSRLFFLDNLDTRMTKRSYSVAVDIQGYLGQTLSGQRFGEDVEADSAKLVYAALASE